MTPQDDPRIRQKAITAAPSYRLAYEDVDFLSGPKLRAARMELEFLKPDHDALRSMASKTRSWSSAARESSNRPRPAAGLDDARQKLAERPDDRAWEACRGPSRADRQEKLLLRGGKGFRPLGFAKLLHGPGKVRFTIMTGGGPGIMEAANRGADDAGAKSVGLNIALPMEQLPNPYITPDLCFQFHYFAIRKFHFVLRAMALVVFPGGFGTIDELFEVLTLRQTGRMQHIPIILIGRDYWRRAINFDFLADEGVILDEDLRLFEFAETAEEAWKIIREFHKL